MTPVVTKGEMLGIPAREISEPARLSASPKASVLMLAFNHEGFIDEAVLGVMAQVCAFDFELLIGDDCSTDATLSKCIEFQRRFPEKIRLITADRNVGMHSNFFRLLARARGPYVALCEGDDYWTSRDKLARQVGCLEEDPGCAFVFHNALVGSGLPGQTMRPFNARAPGAVTVQALIEKDWFVPTASIVFNPVHLTPFPSATYAFPSGDLALQILLAANGSVHYVDEILSVYRINDLSVSQGVKRSPERLLKYGAAFVHMLGELDGALDHRYSRSFLRRQTRTRNWMDYVRLRYEGKTSLSGLWGVFMYALGIATRRGKVA